MNRPSNLRSIHIHLAACLLLALAVVAVQPALAGPPIPTPFACNGEAYIVQGASGLLSRVDQSMSPNFVFIDIGTTGAAFNAIGFRQTDGLLYGWTSNSAQGANELVSVDATGTMTRLGVPTGIPASTVFNAGDVNTLTGTEYYLSQGGSGTLYIVDLTTGPAYTASTVAIMGDSSNVPDLAFNPTDGMLYGGAADGDVVQIDPGTGMRTDTDTPGLPAGDYGGAWFDASGTLFLYENGGQIYPVDLGMGTAAMPTSGPGSSLNDGAACALAIIGAAKNMSIVEVNPPNKFPVDVTITYTFENFSNLQPLHLLSAVDNLVDTFGPNSEWSVTGVTPSRVGFANLSFDGDGDQELIDQGAPGETIAALEVIDIDVVVRVTSNNGEAPQYCNQIQVTGNTDPGGAGIVFGDFSTDGLDPDGSNGDGNPTENQQTCITAPVPVDLIGFSID